jgi:L-2-amino-thiazoline-4-carboxylic acid hydrolase
MQANEYFYIAQSPKLLKNFAKALKPVRKVFVTNFGSELADRILEEARQEYEALIPQLPYWGRKNMMTEFLIGSSHCLAIYRVLKKHGKSVAAIGKIIYEIIEARLNKMPDSVLWFYGKLKYGKSYRERLKIQAMISQKKQFPGDFVFTYIVGDGKEFDYGYDITECGVCKFLHAQDADELAPFLCLVDFPLSKAFGRGLVRNMTISEGAEKCDFRYKKGRYTKEGWPPSFLT